MPQLRTETLGKEQAWALWQISETESELSFLAMESCPEEVVHVDKRLEWLAGRALIRSLVESCGLSYQGLRKDEFGKPFLKNLAHYISLSHSFPFVAAQLARGHSVGIDLEQPKDKLKKIASRVFAATEVKDAGDDIVKLCVYWCAKEALFKIYGRRNVLFTDHLRVRPFELKKEGGLKGVIRADGNETVVGLEYLVGEEFVVVYTAAQ